MATNQGVGGSNPSGRTNKINGLADSHQSAFSFLELGGTLRGTLCLCHKHYLQGLPACALDSESLQMGTFRTFCRRWYGDSHVTNRTSPKLVRHSPCAAVVARSTRMWTKELASLPVRPPPTRHPPLFKLVPSGYPFTLFCSNDPLISGIQQPPLHFQIARPGVYIIFSASPTAQWAVHRSITRSVHPWPCPQPQRSRLRSERPETTLDHCRLLDASYAVVMSWNMERTIMGRADCACRSEMREFNLILRKTILRKNA